MKNKKSIYKSFAKLFLNSIFLLFIISCSIDNAYNPEFLKDNNPSWDGSNQNSGIISYEKDKGFLITETAAKRYSDLTDKFGKTHIPKIKHAEGLFRVDNDYYLPNRYMVIFATFNQKNKRGDTE